MVDELVDQPVVGRRVRTTRAQAEQRQRPHQPGEERGSGIELRVALEAELLDRPSREVARREQLDLAVDRLGVERLRHFAVPRALGPRAGEIAFLVFHQTGAPPPCSGAGNEAEQQAGRRRGDDRLGDEPLAAAERRGDAVEVDLVLLVRCVRIELARAHLRTPSTMRNLAAAWLKRG